VDNGVRWRPVTVGGDVAENAAGGDRRAQPVGETEDESRDFGVDVLDRLRGLEGAENITLGDRVPVGNSDTDDHRLRFVWIDEGNLDDDVISHRGLPAASGPRPRWRSGRVGPTPPGCV